MRYLIATSPTKRTPVGYGLELPSGAVIFVWGNPPGFHGGQHTSLDAAKQGRDDLVITEISPTPAMQAALVRGYRSLQEAHSAFAQVLGLPVPSL
jgi:hypothetical protein